MRLHSLLQGNCIHTAHPNTTDVDPSALQKAAKLDQDRNTVNKYENQSTDNY